MSKSLETKSPIYSEHRLVRIGVITNAWGTGMHAVCTHTPGYMYGPPMSGSSGMCWRDSVKKLCQTAKSSRTFNDLRAPLAKSSQQEAASLSCQQTCLVCDGRCHPRMQLTPYETATKHFLEWALWNCSSMSGQELLARGAERKRKHYVQQCPEPFWSEPTSGGA
eukprot:3874844-Amphidinium_carterae.1